MKKSFSDHSKLISFDEAFLEFHHPLYLYALKFASRRDEALDIVQEVFLKIWQKDELLKDRNILRSYLFTSVKNSCLNYLKHQKVKQKYEYSAALELKTIEAEYFVAEEKALNEKNTLTELNQALNELPHKYREVLILSRYQGMKNKEIAEELNLPLRTIETRIYRGLNLLRERLNGLTVILLSVLGLRKN